MASDRHIDDAIDQAVRDIMRAEPPAGLRGRVLLEIERPSRRFQLRPAFAGAALLIVAAVLVAVLLRPTTTSSVPESTAARHEQPAPAPAASPAPEVKTPSVVPTAPADSTERGRLPAPPPERDRVVFPAPGVVAAANVPVDLEPAVTLVSVPDSAVGTADANTPEPPIVVPRIEITPISIPPIVVTPMLPRSR
jgi:hypothetical protein